MYPGKRRKSTSSSYYRYGLIRYRNLGQLFPTAARITLPQNFVEIAQVNTIGGGTPGGYWYQKGYSMNSLRTPEGTTVHQPRGFDQWMTIYNLYYVVSATVKITLVNSDPTNDAAGIVILYQSRLGTAEILGTGTAFYDNLERARDWDLQARWKHFNSMGGGSTRLTMLTNKFYTRRGYPMEELSTFEGSATVNPTFNREYHVFIRCPQAASTKTMYYEVKVSYDAIFYDPKNITGS